LRIQTFIRFLKLFIKIGANKIMIRFFIYFFAIFVFFLKPVIATEKISLNDCIKQALENNFDIKISKITIDQKKLEYQKKAADFDWQLGLGLVVSNNKTYRAYSFPEALLTKKFQSGVSANLSYSFDFNDYKSNDSIYSSDLEFKFTAPLSKNSGRDINTTFLKIENNNINISNLEMLTKMMQLTADVEKKYWDIIYYIDLLDLKKQNYKLAEDLLENTKKRAQLGALAPIEITRAASGVANREEAIITSENLVATNKDELLFLLNSNSNDTNIFLYTNLILTDTPAIEKIDLDLRTAVDLALKNAPNYNALLKKIENQNIRIKYYENQELPTIDLETTLKLNGADRDWLQTFEALPKAEARSWLIKLGIKIPIGNNYNKSVSAQERLTLAQLLLDLKKSEQQIILNTKARLRDISAAQKKIAAAEKALALAQENYNIELKRFELNQTTAYDVLEFQDALSTAKTNYLKAIIDYKKTIVDFRLATSTILKTHNIIFAQ